MILSERRQADLLDAYWTALGNNTPARPPDELDPEMAALARSLARRRDELEPGDAFIAALEQRLDEQASILHQRGSFAEERSGWSRQHRARPQLNHGDRLEAGGPRGTTGDGQDVRAPRTTGGRLEAGGPRERTASADTVRVPLLMRAVRRRPAAVVAALLVAALVAGAVYAAVLTLGDQALPPLITQENLGRALNVTRGRCGYSMTLNRVYADPQQILIGYTLRAPAGSAVYAGLGGYDHEESRPITLADSQGHRFPGGGDAYGLLVGNAVGDYISFDSRQLTHPPRVLALRLTVPVIAMNLKHTGHEMAEAPCASYSGTTGRARTVKVNGPFTFDISVPVAPARTVSLRATQQVHGTIVALLGAQITPINSRVFFQMTGMTLVPFLSAELGVPASAHLPSVQGRTTVRDGWAYYRGLVESGSYSGHTATYAADVAAPLYGYHGAAKLVVDTPIVAGGCLQTATRPVTFSVTLASTPASLPDSLVHAVAGNSGPAPLPYCPTPNAPPAPRITAARYAALAAGEMLSAYRDTYAAQQPTGSGHILGTIQENNTAFMYIAYALRRPRRGCVGVVTLPLLYDQGHWHGNGHGLGISCLSNTKPIDFGFAWSSGTTPQLTYALSVVYVRALPAIHTLRLIGANGTRTVTPRHGFYLAPAPLSNLCAGIRSIEALNAQGQVVYTLHPPCP